MEISASYQVVDSFATLSLAIRERRIFSNLKPVYIFRSLWPPVELGT